MLICLTVNAQTDKGFIRHGNSEFKNGNYSEAEVNYRKIAVFEFGISVSDKSLVCLSIYGQTDKHKDYANANIFILHFHLLVRKS